MHYVSIKVRKGITCANYSMFCLLNLTLGEQWRRHRFSANRRSHKSIYIYTVCLLLFKVLATSKIISAWLSTCDSELSW